MAAFGSEDDGYFANRMILGTPDMQLCNVVVDPRNGQVLTIQKVSQKELEEMHQEHPAEVVRDGGRTVSGFPFLIFDFALVSSIFMYELRLLWEVARLEQACCLLQKKKKMDGWLFLCLNCKLYPLTNCFRSLLASLWQGYCSGLDLVQMDYLLQTRTVGN